MSSVNKRIIETVEQSNYPKEIKEMLRALLTVELRNFGDKNARYAEDYDRIIKKLADFKEAESEEDGS